MPKTIYSGSGGSVSSGSTSVLKSLNTNGKNYLCEVTPEKAGSSPGTGGGSIILPPVTPGPTRDPSIPIPPGCPSGYPVAGNYPVTEGPGGPTHTIIQAIDIMQPGGLRGVNVLSTAPGVVVYSGYLSSIYGNTVIIEGSCGGQKFTMYFAHLMDNTLIPTNTTISQGQTIGLSDNSGAYPAGNDHIHYEIRGCGQNENPLYCQGFQTLKISDYLPQPVATNCFWNCGVTTGK